MKETHDLTKGPILQRLLWVAIPIMGSQLVQMLYNLTDMFWLGRGVNAAVVAASGTAGMYMWLTMAFMLVGRMGAEIGVSQNIGRQDIKTAQDFSHTSLFLALLLGAACTLIMVAFSAPLIGFFQIQDPAVAKDGADYLSIVAIGIPLTFVSAAVTGTLNAAGNSRMSFLCNATGLILNMILDPILIITFGWGISGAAIATVIAQAVVCLLFLLAIRFHKNRPFLDYRIFTKPDTTKIAQIFRWSTPMGLESMFFTLLAMVVTRFVSAFGTDAITVQRIGSQIESLTWLLGGGFGSAVTAYVGQNFGAGKWSRIRAGYRVSMIVMLVWGVIITLLLFFGGRPLYLIFLPDASIAQMGREYLQILSVCQIAACVEAVGAGCYRGIGVTIPPSVASIVSNALRVPLAFLLSRTALGLTGIWWAVALSALLRGIWIGGGYALRARRQPREDVPIRADMVTE